MNDDKIVPFPGAERSSICAAQAWTIYVECARRAQATRRLDDGIAAGKAWAQFIDLFVPKSTLPKGAA